MSIDFVSDPKVNFAHADDGEDGGVGGHGRKEVNNPLLYLLYFCLVLDLGQLQGDNSGQ